MVERDLQRRRDRAEVRLGSGFPVVRFLVEAGRLRRSAPARYVPTMSEPPNRAVILGGSGAMGTATALRLAAAGWQVDVTHRSGPVSPALAETGVRLHRVERSDTTAVDRLVGDGTDLLVDILAYRAEDVDALLPAMRRTGRTVLISSRAVYVDADGHHIHGDVSPHFPVPIPESQPTLPPAPRGTNPFSREGYAPLQGGCGACRARLGPAGDRPAPVEGPRSLGAQAANPGAHPLHDCSDVHHRGRSARRRRPPDGGQQRRRAHRDDRAPAGSTRPQSRRSRRAHRRSDRRSDRRAHRLAGAPGAAHRGAAALTGEAPWFAEHPIVLDTSAEALGYTAAGSALDLLREEVDWVLTRQT